jgi:hypothetical protein
MSKLIPTIYFYLLSLIGFILLIIGIFSCIHFIIGITIYNKYPLPNGMENQCMYSVPPLPAGDKQQLPMYKDQYANCTKNLEEQRIFTKNQDLEKALSFTIIGLLVFGIHFYFARKQK